MSVDFVKNSEQAGSLVDGRRGSTEIKYESYEKMNFKNQVKIVVSTVVSGVRIASFSTVECITTRSNRLTSPLKQPSSEVVNK